MANTGCDAEWGWAVPLGESIVRFVYVGRGTLSLTHPTERLVVSGLYRYVRNPMYVGVLMLIAGQAVLFWSSTLWAYFGYVAFGLRRILPQCASVVATTKTVASGRTLNASLRCEGIWGFHLESEDCRIRREKHD